MPGNAGTAREPFVTNIDAETLAVVTAAQVAAAAAADPASTAASASVGPASFDPENPQAILGLARHLRADLTVIGPEAPLAAGVVDAFNEAGLAIFGPSQNASRW